MAAFDATLALHGAAFINLDDPFIAPAAKRFGEKGVTDAIGLAGYYGITAMALAVAKATYPAGAEPKLETLAQAFPR